MFGFGWECRPSCVWEEAPVFGDLARARFVFSRGGAEHDREARGVAVREVRSNAQLFFFFLKPRANSLPFTADAVQKLKVASSLHRSVSTGSSAPRCLAPCLREKNLVTLLGLRGPALRVNAYQSDAYQRDGH